MDEKQTTTQPQAYRNEQDPALLYAWQLYVAYNDASDKQKMLHADTPACAHSVIGWGWLQVLWLVSALPYVGDLFAEH